MTPLGRGHAQLYAMLDGLRTSYNVRSFDVDNLIPKAIPVDLSRSSVPASAGTLDPQAILPPDKAEAVRSLASTATPAALLGDAIPKPCDLVPPSQEADFRRKMLNSNMVHMVLDDCLERDAKGRPILYGRFCVSQNASKDRLIFDGRAPSFGEVRLAWMKLPHGSQFARLRLRPSQSVRGSGGRLADMVLPNS